MDWILCKNQTPSKAGKYLVYTKNGHFCIDEYTDKFYVLEIPNGVYQTDWHWEHNKNVVAWMPLIRPEIK